MPYTRTSAIALLLMLSACAKPIVAPPVTAMDTQKDCAALEQDIAETTELKRAAREEDRFQWKYIFVVNAATSWHRMNTAEKAAVERLEKLNSIAAAKGCLGGELEKVLTPMTPATPSPVAPPPAEPTPPPAEGSSAVLP